MAVIRRVPHGRSTTRSPRPGFVFAVAFILLTILVLLAANDARERYVAFSIDRYRTRMANRARAGAAELTRTLAEVQRNLSLLATTAITRPALSSPAREFTLHIARLLESRGVVAAVTSVDGQVVVSPASALPGGAREAVLAARRLCPEGGAPICITRAGGKERTLIVMSTRHVGAGRRASALISLVCDLDLIARRARGDVVADSAMRLLLLDEGRHVISWPDRSRPRPVIRPGHIDEGWKVPHVRVGDEEFLFSRADAHAGDGIIGVAVMAPIHAGIASIGPGSTRALLLFSALLLLVAFIVLQLHRVGTRQLRALADAHAELRRLNDDLENQVRQRTGALERMHLSVLAARHEVAARERDAVIGELASVFAHEVRTPLNALSIANQRMRRGLRRKGRIDPETAAEILQDQAESVAVIGEYVQRYLGLASKGREVEEAIDPGALFGEVFRLVQDAANAAGVRLSARSSPEVGRPRVRRGTLRHVVLNLVANAIQAQPEGGSAEVEALVREGRLVVQVRDRGPGVPPERAEEIFEPFRSWKEGGTGLGLSISRRFAAELGGTLEYEPRAGGGAVFALHIPLVPGGPGEGGPA